MQYAHRILMCLVWQPFMNKVLGLPRLEWHQAYVCKHLLRVPKYHPKQFFNIQSQEEMVAGPSWCTVNFRAEPSWSLLVPAGSSWVFSHKPAGTSYIFCWVWHSWLRQQREDSDIISFCCTESIVPRRKMLTDSSRRSSSRGYGAL